MPFRSRIPILFLICLITPLPVVVSAIPNTEDFKPGLIRMSESASVVSDPAATDQPVSMKRKERRVEKRIERVNKLIARKGVPGLSDPDNRFFWYWVGGWGAGLLLTLLAGGAITSGGLAILWFTLFVGGAISLVLWLVKRFG